MTMTEQESTSEARESGLLRREFETEISSGDGRTLDIRIVPFGERAVVADGFGGVPVGVPYEEEWMPGCFDKQLRAADKIYLNFQHEPGLRGIIGKGLALRAASDGYHASFRVLNGDDCEKALELVREDVLTGASIEVPMRTVKSKRSADGVIQRVKGHLDAVALCRIGAFASAAVLAVREQEHEIEDEPVADVVPPPNPELLARLRRLNIRLPDRYKTQAERDEADALLQRAMVDMAWDGSASRWPTAAAYCSASAIDLNRPGAPKTKAACHLPYKEPNGDININGVRAALSRLGQGFPSDASQAQRDRARTMLEGMLQRFNSQNGGQ